MMDLNKFFDEFNKKTGYERPNTVIKDLSPNLKEGKTIKGGQNEQPKTSKPNTPPPAQKPIQKKIDEGIVEKSLTYTSVILKNIRETFDDEQRPIIYESLYNAISQLVRQGGTYTPPVQHTLEQQVELSEDAKEELRIVESNGYSRDMGLKATPNGVDLSNVSQQDIADFKALAGI